MSDTSGKDRVYIFDTSVFLNLYLIDRDSMRLPDEVWDKLDELMQEGHIISHRYVYDEIVSDSKDPDKISAWLLARKAYFPKESVAQVTHMIEVVKKFPKLIDADNEKEQADPWLVALAVEFNSQYDDKEFIVVTQEKKTKSTNLPAACSDFKVEAISLAEFFEEVGIKFGISVAHIPNYSEISPLTEVLSPSSQNP